MTLRDYKDRYPFLLEDFAKAVGVKLTQASDLVNGKRQCSLDVAVKIEAFTNNRVRCKDLLIPKPKGRGR